MLVLVPSFVENFLRCVAREVGLVIRWCMIPRVLRLYTPSLTHLFCLSMSSCSIGKSYQLVITCAGCIGTGFISIWATGWLLGFTIWFLKLLVVSPFLFLLLFGISLGFHPLFYLRNAMPSWWFTYLTLHVWYQWVHTTLCFYFYTFIDSLLLTFRLGCGVSGLKLLCQIVSHLLKLSNVNCFVKCSKKKKNLKKNLRGTKKELIFCGESVFENSYSNHV